jgi:hypothetical protein
MPILEVQPRDTPAERDDEPVAVTVDDAVAVHAATIDDWVAPRQNWDFTLREGHEFGRANNVEGRLLFVSGDQTSSLVFRLDQLDGVDDFGDELVLRFEERDGIAKAVRATANGLEVDFHHILTYT